jgi:cell division septum initiation protein DivIVA
LNEIKLFEDVIKAVVSVQEENVKLKKQVEQLIRDKAKGLKQIDATNSRNKWSAVSSSAGGS